MFVEFEQLARSRIDLKWKPPEPDIDEFKYDGDLIPHNDAYELWLKWEENAFMPHPGGYWDQHPHWRAMIHKFRRLYQVVAWNVRYDVALRDKK